ncbi:Stk1 family PASTA domain-containing Ser/Thr kinase [Planotetraspora mira]|uniref:non-specific serine/threonine protein kinase n=1 Tax=Planotetraspora mira TaxID=58121 RepID=A0A8J3TJI0_9ACTN|nr:Stk1 family PASTA domain-containing Ser/Thr kinase [Planotetraspora mira]GII26801.1 serine/threonine protein kinase [Planotetraspora mira]
MDTTLTDPIVGHVLDGRYRVESRIARGGMASVYLALDVRLDRTVAVKVMHHTLAEDPQFVRRFIGEARSVASLSHPNIVQVFDQGTDGKHVYLSMEYVPGRTLRDVLRKRGRLPAREALEIVIPVLAALGAAHQAGLVHRDVKPENVLLTDDGRVKVVDFGLARAVEATNQTKTGIMIGTIGYMSPEQVTAGLADSRSDVYAVGIMLFELLTGRQPYEGDTPMSVAYRHVHDSVPVPSAVVGDIAPQLDALVAAATDRDPARRPSDATAMLVAAVEVHRVLPKTPKAGQHAAPVSLSTAAMPAEPYSTGQYLAPGHHTPAPPNHTMIQPRTDLMTAPPDGPRRNVLKRRSTWFIAGLALLMVAGVALTGWWFSQGRYTKVPDLLNQNITVAKHAAEQQGFVVTVGKARFDDHVEKDLVLESDPVAGTEVDKGARITLIPSAGPETVPVPKVQGLSEADAREAIGQAGLNVGRVSKTASDTVARGLIVKTSPDVGKRVRKNSTVNLVVSAGLLMPDVTQMMRDQAEQFLREKGFNVQIDETADDTAPGTVIAQDPAGGSETVAGANVRLTVSRGPDQGFHWPWENNGDQQANLVNVPDVRFKNVQDAQNELKAAGFKVKTRNLVGTQRVVGEQPLGQQPAGTTIMIWH